MPPAVKRPAVLLLSDDAHDRVKGAQALGRMGPAAADAVPLLVGLLADNRAGQSAFEKIWGVFSLGGTGIGVNRAAKDALVQIGPPAVEPLIAALDDQRPRVRQNAALALGELKDPRALGPLATLLGDRDAEVRTWTAKALGDLGCAGAVEPLIAALGDSVPAVRQYAAVSLGTLDDQRAVGPLIDALADPSVGADVALFQITGQRLGGDAAAWREWLSRQSP